MARTRRSAGRCCCRSLVGGRHRRPRLPRHPPVGLLLAAPGPDPADLERRAGHPGCGGRRRAGICALHPLERAEHARAGSTSSPRRCCSARPSGGSATSSTRSCTARRPPCRGGSRSMPPHRIGEWANLDLFPEATTRFHPLFAYEAHPEPGRPRADHLDRPPLRHRLYDGDILLIYLMWYWAVRTYLETFRVQNWVIAGRADRHLAGHRHLRRWRAASCAAPRSRLGHAGRLDQGKRRRRRLRADADGAGPPAEPRRSQALAERRASCPM